MPKELLSDVVVKQAQPKEKDYWLADGGGLRLLIKTNGTKCWRYNYRFSGKQKTLALGVYPSRTLKEARLLRQDAEKLISNKIDPAEARQQQLRENQLKSANRFSLVAEQWWHHQKGTWSEDHALRVWTRLQVNVFPALGDRPIHEIQPLDVIHVVKQIEKRNALDVAQRVNRDVGRVFSYAVQHGLMSLSPSSELRGIVKTRKQRHRASLPREELPRFLRELDQYDTQGRLLTKLALQLLLLTFVRPGELRGARWDEFDLDQALWRIPGHRMKMGTEHLVPLSPQALAVIDQIHPISSQYEFLFPSERNRHDYMSDNTMRKALIRMGYDGKTAGKSQATPHGFRATASSILNETGFNPDAIERQLSHMERNGVRAAYTHHARYMAERREMMNWWAEYLERCKEAGTVLPVWVDDDQRAVQQRRAAMVVHKNIDNSHPCEEH